MGYSNNKWRKILTILMIINLCFVLFAKFTKVFGASISPNLISPDEINMPSWLDNYNWNIAFFNNGNNYIGYRVFITDKNNKILLKENTNNYSIYLQGVKSYNFLSGSKTKSNLISYLEGLTEQSLSSQSNSDGNTFISIEKSYITNNNFYTNSPLYNYSSSNDIIVDSNIFHYPHFDNVTEIENGYPDGVFISRGHYSENENLYFHLLKIDYTLSSNDGTIYYYSPKVFMLNKDSKYYKTYGADVDNDYSYYYVNRYYLNLDPNARYLYVLTNSSESFNNSVGLIEEDKENGIYHVISSNTTGVVTSQDSTNDKIQNIEDNMTDTTPDPNIDNDISSSFDYDNSNTQLDNAQGGFFSRLMSLFSSMYDYDITEVTTINVPLPHTQKVITLRSDIISSHIVDPLKSLITAFWAFVFYMYGYKFLNYIFIEIKEGKILDGDSLNNCPGTLQANIF